MNKVNFGFMSCDNQTMIHGVKWMPDENNVIGVVQIVHGMVEYIERYEDFANFLTKRGYVVYGHDHLGHGDSVNSTDDWGFVRENAPEDALISDVNSVHELIKSEYPGIPHFILGHSMGSYVVRRYISLYNNENIAGAILSGVGSIDAITCNLGLAVCSIIGAIKGDRHRSPFLESLIFGGPYKKFSMGLDNPENSWLTKDTAIVTKYYNDPKCTFKFTINGYKALIRTAKYDFALKNIAKIKTNLPIFIIAGADDPVGNLGKGSKQVYDRFVTAGLKNVKFKLYENDRHEILNETDKENVYEDIYLAMQSQMN